MENCIFCKVIKGEIPCDKIFENDFVLAFLDIKPTSPGHTLIIPKKHYNTILDMPEKELCETIKVIQKIAKAVLEAVGTKAFNIVVNTGKDAGQLIDHVHFHIIPRLKDDKRNFFLNPISYKNNEKQKILEKIKKVLK
jgi:histidine triad (HIT) family protein